MLWREYTKNCVVLGANKTVTFKIVIENNSDYFEDDLEDSTLQELETGELDIMLISVTAELGSLLEGVDYLGGVYVSAKNGKQDIEDALAIYNMETNALAELEATCTQALKDLKGCTK